MLAFSALFSLTSDVVSSLQKSPTSLEDHLRAWNKIDNSIIAHQWLLASIAASLTLKYAESTVQEFALKVDRSISYIYQLANTHNAFEESKRLESLSFTHHLVAAQASDPAQAISTALIKHLSTRELETLITAEKKDKRANKDTGWMRGRGSSIQAWAETEQAFSHFTDRQLILYALKIYSRIPKSTHLEMIEAIIEIEDLKYEIAELRDRLTNKAR